MEYNKVMNTNTNMIIEQYFQLKQQEKQIKDQIDALKPKIEALYIKKDGLEHPNYTVSLNSCSRDYFQQKQLQQENPKLWSKIQSFFKPVYYTQLSVKPKKESKVA